MRFKTLSNVISESRFYGLNVVVISIADWHDHNILKVKGQGSVGDLNDVEGSSFGNLLLCSSFSA